MIYDTVKSHIASSSCARWRSSCTMLELPNPAANDIGGIDLTVGCCFGKTQQRIDLVLTSNQLGQAPRTAAPKRLPLACNPSTRQFFCASVLPLTGCSPINPATTKSRTSWKVESPVTMERGVANPSSCAVTFTESHKAATFCCKTTPGCQPPHSRNSHLYLVRRYEAKLI